MSRKTQEAAKQKKQLAAGQDTAACTAASVNCVRHYAAQVGLCPRIAERDTHLLATPISSLQPLHERAQDSGDFAATVILCSACLRTALSLLRQAAGTASRFMLLVWLAEQDYSFSVLGTLLFS